MLGGVSELGTNNEDVKGEQGDKVSDALRLRPMSNKYTKSRLAQNKNQARYRI